MLRNVIQVTHQNFGSIHFVKGRRLVEVEDVDVYPWSNWSCGEKTETKLVCSFFCKCFYVLNLIRAGENIYIAWCIFYLKCTVSILFGKRRHEKASLKLMKWLHLTKVIHPKWIIIIIFPAPSFMEHFAPFLADSHGFTACNLFWFCLSHFHIQRAAVFRRKALRTIVQNLLSTKWQRKFMD